MSARSDVAASSADREIVMTRVFDAPRELVFDAWTDPKHVAEWWGPRGFTTTVSEHDLRVGGLWRFVMHGPDGTDYQNRVVYREIVRPERLVYTHGSDADPDQFLATIVFAAEGAKTRLTLRMEFPSAAVCEGKKAFGAVELGYQTLDKFGEHLATRL